MDRVRARITKQGQLGSSAPAVVAARTPQDAVWESVCTAQGYDALDGLEAKAFAAARKRFLEDPRHEALRLTGTKHPDSTAHRAEQLDRALRAAPEGAPDRARLALTHLEWHPLMEARLEYEESIADLLGPCSEVLLDLEGRQISPDWLDVPERVVLALMRHGIVPGEDRHLLFRVPNPFIEQDEEKVSKILASVARANVLFHLACERVGVVPKQNAIHEITVPQVNSTAEIGAVVKVGTLYLQAVAGLLDGPPEHVDAFLGKRVPKARRAELLARVARVRLVPLCENVGALAHLPDLLEAFYLALERGRRGRGSPDPGDLPHLVRSPRGRRPRLRRDVGHRRAEREGRHRRRLHACPRGTRGGRAPPRRARAAALRARPVGDLPDRRRPGRLPRRVRPRPPGGPPAVRARRWRHHAGHPGRRARRGGPSRRRVPGRGRGAGGGEGLRPRPARPGRRRAPQAARGGGQGPHRDTSADSTSARLVREPRAPDPRPHPRHGLGQLRALDSHLPGGVGRGHGASPTTATCATPGRRGSLSRGRSSTTSPARPSACPR